MNTPHASPLRTARRRAWLIAAALLAISALALAPAGLRSVARAAGPPFGNAEDVAFAQALWQQLQQALLVGPQTIHTTPYKGTEPHGAILETLERELSVNGHAGPVLVKKNYVGKNLSKMEVANHPDRHLNSITVMFRREAGYDPQDLDWFWVKYNPDGSVQKNPKGIAMAGRVAKGAPKGCIACHTAAPGHDFVYNHDRFAR